MNVILLLLIVLFELKKKFKRVFNDFFEFVYLFGIDGIVNDFVVEVVSDDDLFFLFDVCGVIFIFDWDGNFLGVVDSKDGSLRGVDDGGEMFDSGVYVYVGDGDGVVLVFFGFEFVIMSFFGKFFDGS